MTTHLEPSISMQINVLMPIYKTTLEWVQAAVESILYQNHYDFNLVIVDDNNPQGALKDYLKTLSLKFGYVKLIHTTENKGIAAALNHGLSACNGDLIVRMDSDDVAHPDLLSQHDAYFKANPDHHVCGVGITLSNGAKSWEKRNPKYMTRAMACIHPGHWFVNHPGVAFRRKAIQQLGGYPEVSPDLAEDYALWVQFLLHGYTIYNNPEILITYRVHPAASEFAPDRKSKVWHEFLYNQRELLYEY